MSVKIDTSPCHLISVVALNLVSYPHHPRYHHLLGPLTHQATGGIAHLLLDVGDWTWRIQRFKLEADHTEMLGHTQCLAGRVTKLFERDGIGKQ